MRRRLLMPVRGSLYVEVTISSDTRYLRKTVRVLKRIADRASALERSPELCDGLLQVVEALPGALKAVAVHRDGGAAGTGERRLRLEFRKWFLRRVSALWALDRDLRRTRKARHRRGSVVSGLGKFTLARGLSAGGAEELGA